MGRHRLIFFLFVLISVGLEHSSNGQTLRYKIVWKGDSVGFLSANLTENANKAHYIIESEASFWVLKRFNLTYYYESIVNDSTMTFAKTSYHLNEKLKSSSLIHKNHSGYDITVNGEPTENNHSQISKNITSVYHRPPLYSTQVFSERYGVFCDWKKMEPSKYELTKPDGRTNIYEYKDGICNRVTVNNRFATFYFELVDPPQTSQ